MLATIGNEVSVELAPGFMDVKRGRRKQKSALAARREGLPEAVAEHVRPMPRGRRFLSRFLAGFLP